VLRLWGLDTLTVYVCSATVQVIERTAKFVFKEGKKMEAMLKVKHGGNAAFQFLLVDHPLQAYYQALLKYLGYCPEAADLPTLLPSVEQTAEPAAEASTGGPSELAVSEQQETAVVKVEAGEGAVATAEATAATATATATATVKVEVGEGAAATAEAAAAEAAAAAASVGADASACASDSQDSVQQAGHIPIPSQEMVPLTHSHTLVA